MQPRLGRLQLVLLALLTIGASAHARADYDADFVRVTCVPQSRYFEIEYKPLHSDVVDGGDYFDSTVWAKQGYLSPSALRYECQLPDSKYVVTSAQPAPQATGMCGAAPEIRLSLARNGRSVVKDVVFGGTCMGGASVMRIWVEDGHSGWYGRRINVCMARLEESGREDCESIYGDIESGRGEPITQETVDACLGLNRAARFKCLAYTSK